jgi:aminoglycoside phosphotransferase (APT) family kinase protein
MEDLVKKVVEQVFNVSPSSIEEIKGKGKNNLVFKIIVNQNPVILRLSNRENTLELYQKEKWCAEALENTGVSTPRILAAGVLEDYAYSFQEFVSGIQGNDKPEELSNIWFTLGHLASLINKVPAPSLQLDYRKFIEGLFRDDYFVTRSVFSSELEKQIETRLEETYTWEFSPTLCHGNLSPSNVIVDSAGVMHVIDWETATGNRTPQSELAEIYTWNTGKENIGHFLLGYGLTEDEVNNMMRDIQTLILLRLVHVIVRKMPKDNDWRKDDKTVATVMMLANINDYDHYFLFTKNL